jgi:hypothetical protein
MWDGRQPLIDFIRAMINKASGKHGKQFKHEIIIGVGPKAYVMMFGYTEFGTDKVAYYSLTNPLADILSIEDAVDKFIDEYKLND